MDKKEIIKQQIRSMIPDFEDALMQEVDRLTSSGAISEDDYNAYLEGGDSYALAKMIITCWFRVDPYAPRDKNMIKFMKNLILF